MRPRPRPRAEHLLPLACAAAALMLLVSQFMNVYELNGGPGQTFQRIGAVHQHSIALAVLALFALGALLVAVLGGSKPAAAAVAIAGFAALLLFLLLDLPDVGKKGTLSGGAFFDAHTDPTLGFWLELCGAVILSVCGGALATLSSEQLRALVGSFRWKRDRHKEARSGLGTTGRAGAGAGEAALKGTAAKDENAGSGADRGGGVRLEGSAADGRAPGGPTDAAPARRTLRRN